MICKTCGKEIADNATVCPECGAPQQAQATAGAVVDNGGFAWGLLGFCIPLVGLILFLVWKDQKPKTAKTAGIGALIGAIIGVVSYVLLAALGMASGAATGTVLL